jgi:hypothetical protein
MREMVYKCSDCGSEIKKKQTHCLTCNSIKKTVVLNFEDGITVKEQISGKVKDYSKPSNKRTTVKFISGSEQSANGNWVEKESLIDANADVYFESITDENGKVIHVCSEKLQAHVGHGSDKFSKKK